ncbi:DUF2889 domain-containing protein [Sphingobium sp. WCS2017Hpa-17]|uniref:DUF2889 domain-containing protein n=1 Tax=Sphingobium sp. WCS2017Hpa-17 TaxID=3073638 RepID=UPI00288B1680|nr:DUF2889 domain-containing protein [Sphingobium sp. WCS2017Hpa-17]
MSIDVDWPLHAPENGRFEGRARDLATPADGSLPRIIASDSIQGNFGSHRTIADIRSGPTGLDVAALAGQKAGSSLRAAIDGLFGDASHEAPLYLLLDDLAGASLVSKWCWARYHAIPDPHAGIPADDFGGMAGVCIGFRPGSSAFVRAIGDGKPKLACVLPLIDPVDPVGWHDFPEHGTNIHFRRARLIDVWMEGDQICVQSLFQDSANLPGTALREALHEYRLEATADRQSGRLMSLEATAGTLPHPECQSATANIEVLLGTPMQHLRSAVLEWLKRTAGCTHLNDMIRALGEVPLLAENLDR